MRKTTGYTPTDYRFPAAGGMRDNPDMDRNAPPTVATGIPAGLTITDDLTASEDITIDGRVEGQVTATDHHLVIGDSASLKAKLIARVVIVGGTVEGSILGAERVRVLASATVRGHITTPSLYLADGAIFSGTVDPQRTEAATLVARYRQRQAGSG
jgi:cytoskeletal protein CcmA (bactofilin family)